MTDYSEQGAIPVEDAAVPNPPTVDEVLARQRELEAQGGAAPGDADAGGLAGDDAAGR